MSKNNSSFKLEDNYTVKDETDNCLDSIKDEIDPDQNNDDGNQLNHNKDFGVDVDKIKSEKDYRNPGIQNTIFVKEEFNVKEEILTYHNNDDNYGSYLTENVEVNNFKSRNIKIDTSNICEETKTENTTIQYNDDNNPLYYNDNLLNKIEPMSPEHCNKFSENIFEIKTEIDYNPNNFENLTNVLTSENEDINSSSIIHLESHANSVKNIHGKLYDCNVCQKSFTCIEELNTHIAIHTSKKRYECDMCKKSYALKKFLEVHINTHTTEMSYKCDICNKCFVHKDYLRRHMVIHNSIKPYKCGICQKSFTRNPVLKRHMFIHTDEKPFKCSICSKLFKRKDHLKLHMFSHNSIKPHKCSICLKSFKFKNHLNCHILIHTSIKQHKCNICFHSFKLKKHLKCHMFTHTNIKPYKCNNCHKSFKHKCSLKKHEFTHSHGKS